MANNKSHLIKPLLGSELPHISHGKGIYLYDTNGKCYIDGASGAVTVNIGHGVVEVVEAMLEQAKSVSFVYRSQFTSHAAEKLATNLANITNGELGSVFFVNSGSEATETALKIAIQYWQEKGKSTKNKILSRKTSYHGITLGALSMSGHMARRDRFESLLADYPVVSPPYCYRCPFSEKYPTCGLKCANELEEKVQEIGANHIAAFIMEPIIGAAGGAITPPDGYHQKIKEICTRYEILLIADEVMTGCGRSGTMLAMDHWGVLPDIVALGKGLSSGYTPMAATLVSNQIINTIESGTKVIMSGHTFSANPQSSAICNAVMKYMEDQQLIGNAKQQGNMLQKELERLVKRTSIIGDVRGLGLLRGIEFVAEKNTKRPFDPKLKITERIVKECFQNGLIVYPAVGCIDGFVGDAVLVAPPLVVTTEEIKSIIDIFENVISKITNELKKEKVI